MEDLLDRLLLRRDIEAFAFIRDAMEKRQSSSPLVIATFEMNTFDVRIDYEREMVLIEDVLDGSADGKMEMALDAFRRRIEL